MLITLTVRVQLGEEMTRAGITTQTEVEKVCAVGLSQPLSTLVSTMIEDAYVSASRRKTAEHN